MAGTTIWRTPAPSARANMASRSASKLWSSICAWLSVSSSTDYWFLYRENKRLRSKRAFSEWKVQWTHVRIESGGCGVLRRSRQESIMNKLVASALHISIGAALVFGLSACNRDASADGGVGGVAQQQSA